MIKKRFNAYLKIKNFPHRSANYKNVMMILFKPDLTAAEKKELPSIIKNYKKMNKNNKLYAQSIAEELFTDKEVSQMKVYFKSFKNTKLQQHRVELPLNADNRMGVGAIPVGGLQGFYMFSEQKNYSLKFKVWGYYDLRQYEFVSQKYPKISDGIRNGGRAKVNKGLQKGLEDAEID